MPLWSPDKDSRCWKCKECPIVISSTDRFQMGEHKKHSAPWYNANLANSGRLHGLFGIECDVCSDESFKVQVGIHTHAKCRELRKRLLSLKHIHDIRVIFYRRQIFTHWPLGNFKWNLRHIIFKQILVIHSWGIFHEIALAWMSLDVTDDQATFAQVMAWCRQATSHYLGQWTQMSVAIRRH